MEWMETTPVYPRTPSRGPGTEPAMPLPGRYTQLWVRLSSTFLSCHLWRLALLRVSASNPHPCGSRSASSVAFVPRSGSHSLEPLAGCAAPQGKASGPCCVQPPVGQGPQGGFVQQESGDEVLPAGGQETDYGPQGLPTASPWPGQPGPKGRFGLAEGPQRQGETVSRAPNLAGFRAKTTAPRTRLVSVPALLLSGTSRPWFWPWPETPSGFLSPPSPAAAPGVPSVHESPATSLTVAPSPGSLSPLPCSICAAPFCPWHS